MQAARLFGQGGSTVGGLGRHARYPLSFASRGVHNGGQRKSAQGESAGKKSKNRDEESKLFSPENLQGISHLEVARMKVAYDLVKEHASVVEEKKPPLDPESNPMIDPRSFEVRTLPRLPKETLAAFRAELPAKAAGGARPVPTYAVWETQEALGEDLVGADAPEWAAVDERTMDARHFARMRRQSINAADVAPPYAAAAHATAVTRARRKCVLSDERGRVDVDFRSVAKLNAFVSEGGKIFSRRKTGLSAKAQRKLSRAVKSARQMALIAPDPDPGLTFEEMQEMERTMQRGARAGNF